MPNNHPTYHQNNTQWTVPTYQNNTQWTVTNAQDVQQIMKGQSGNPNENLTELQQAVQELRKRKPGDRKPISPPAFAIIDDQNTTRLFKPSLPMNQYVHPDDHLAWLRGRTITVCRKSAWARTTS